MMSFLLYTLLLLAPPSAEAPAAKSAIPDLPEPISSFGACMADDAVYVYGGHSGKTHTYSRDTTLGKFRRLRPGTDTAWQELPESLHLQGLALVAHQGRVIRVGGMEPRNKRGDPSDSVSTATVQAFDPKAGKWADLPPLPAPRSSHDAVVVGDTLIVVGGWNMRGKEDSVWHDTFHTLDLKDPKAKWTTEKQPFVRRALTATAHDGKVYVLCGLTNGGGTDHSVNILDPMSGKWADGPKVPGDRMNGFTPAAVVVGRSLYLSPADGVVYKLAGDKWEEAGKVATPRWVHRAVPIGSNGFLVIGGAAKGGSRADVETISVK